MKRYRMRRAQALVETVLAVLFVSLLFLTLFGLSQLLTGKILVQHAAMRVARARTVGLNDFMCLKAARLAVLPAAGKRIRPEEKPFTYEMERARFANYLIAPRPGIAAAVLDYVGWRHLEVDAGDGTDADVSFGIERMLPFDVAKETCGCADCGCTRTRIIHGNAGVEQNYPFYLQDQGK